LSGNFIIPAYQRIYYTTAEIRAAAAHVGFQTHLDIMVAIGFAESSGSNAIQQNEPYATTGWGCWQITPGNSEPSVGVDLQLLDLYTNALAARKKFDAQGLQAWSTYNNGVYKKYLGFQRAERSMSAPVKTVCHPVTFVKEYPDGTE
jgi:hypothetical protein